MKFISRVVTSQVNIIVQPMNAEAYDFPAGIAQESQELADREQRPVVLLDRNDDRHEFLPRVGARR